MEYSLDLRERVIGAVDNGMPVAVSARTFRVSRRVVYKWLELRRETGKLEAKTGYQKGHNPKITDWEKFKQFANKNRQYAAPRMVEEWYKETAVKVSESCIYRGLAKLDYTSKKNFSLRRSQ